MGEAMVTGRMAPGKKRRGGLVLQREGLTASQAINRMYDKLIENGDASFLTGIVAAEDEAAWDNAVEFVDSLSEPVSDGASDADDEAPSALAARAFEHRHLPAPGPCGHRPRRAILLAGGDLACLRPVSCLVPKSSWTS